ncbi:MAG TPA: family 43 glycosylhydrolase [Paludibacter sp.]|nr:family 43 glycosylhydrolase [Paludibacter sp.]
MLLAPIGTLFAQFPSIAVSYTFENQKPADDNNTYAGSLSGSAKIVQMVDGNHALYTGSGYLDLGSAAGKAIAAGLTGNYSVSVDVCLANSNTLSNFCWLYSMANGTSQYLGLINTGGNSNWYYEVKNGSTSNVKTSTGLSTQGWHNVTVVQNGTTNTVYIDGVAKASGTISVSPSSFASSISSFCLGKSPFTADALLTNTLIDNFKIYNSALTASQVTSISSATQALSPNAATKLVDAITKRWEAKGNPVVTHKFTCDPAPMVYNDTLFIFTGEDNAGGQSNYNIKNWCCFATTDMKHFWEYNVPLRAADFSWNTGQYAYAGQVIPRNGKFYWYVSTNNTGIGVAVADRPEGPYKDALGRALLTNSNSTGGNTNSWRTIDPTVYIDGDNQAWLIWGNGDCWCCKLNQDMISFDTNYGVKKIAINGTLDFPYTEAPWIHKYNGKYYLSFAAGFPERIEYAVADNIEGPYTYGSILCEIAGNSNTIHQGVVQYKNNWYFIYHNGGVQPNGGSYSRSMCIDKLEFDPQGFYKPVIMTTKGVDALPTPGPDAVKEISQTPNSPFKIDVKAQTITMPMKYRYQIVDTVGRVVSTGKKQVVSISGMHPGVYLITNGSESGKFIKH